MSQSDEGLENRRKWLQRKEKGKKLTDIPELTESRERDDQENADEENALLTQEGLRAPETLGQVIYGLFSTRTKQAAHFATYEPVTVKRYSHGKTFRQRLAYIAYTHENISFYLRIFGFLLNIVASCLFIVEAIWSDVAVHEGFAVLSCQNWTINFSVTASEIDSSENILILIRAFLSYKSFVLWMIQLLISVVITITACISLYVRQEIHGSLFKNFRKWVDVNLVIILLLGLMYAISLLFSQLCLQYLFIPSFLYCWPARYYLTYVVGRSSRASFFGKHKEFRATAFNLLTFLLCFMYSAICFVHHFEQLGTNIDLFNSYWFVIVTFSTVGYGDISPGHWTSKLVVTIFIGAALIYLPLKIERLWNAFQLHRKHDSEYRKPSNTKHVILASVFLKPLVLADFLTEFYSDPQQTNTHTVLLVEKPLPRGTKSLLAHHIWGRRLTVILGSSLRHGDLSRARARDAVACFILTNKYDKTPAESDRHTILSVWTIKSFAPKCKLFVQILLPESKFHLHDVDNVLCQQELKNALLAKNCLCPGVSTLVVLLLHTFQHEARGFKLEDYRVYEECAAAELYHARLGNSQYFHKFVGKNFVFTALVVYRRYNIALLGVKDANTGMVLLNPGVTYFMKESDICYYASEEDENFFEFSVEHPSSFHKDLWRASATVALLSLRLAGIQLPDGEAVLKQEKRKTSVHSLQSLKTDEALAEKETDLIAAADVCNWQQEDKRGLQLLRYHAEQDRQVKPSVKLNVVPKLSEEVTPRNLQIVTEQLGSSEPELQVLVERGPCLTRQVSDRGLVEHHPPRNIFKSIRRSISNGSSHFREVHRQRSSNMLNIPETGSVASYSSSTDMHQLAPVHQLPPIDKQVVLELDDIQEKEELEDLEEGREGEDDLQSDEEWEDTLTCNTDTMGAVPVDTLSKASSPSSPTSIHSLGLGQAGDKYIKGPVPVLPYCGCESMACHLLPLPRQLEEIRVQQGGNWQRGAMLVYSDAPSNDLFHFVVPLRAAYLPVSCLKPVILVLGQEPSLEFVSLISQLPMIHFIVGSLDNLNVLLHAGIQVAESLVVLAPTGKTLDEDSESLVDAGHIAAMHKIARLFPRLRMTAELVYRFNIRFLYTTVYERLTLQKLRNLARKGDHLTYLFLPPFASAKAFSSTMLETLLYQAFQKPNIIDLYRQLLGCTQNEGSGYLWKVNLTESMLDLKIYVKLFHHLAIHHRCIPIGIYRSSKVSVSPVEMKGYSQRDLGNLQKFLQGRLHSLKIGEEVPELLESQEQQFVFANPPSNFELKRGDIAIVIRSPSKPHSSLQPRKKPSYNNPLPTVFEPTFPADEESCSHCLTVPLPDHHNKPYLLRPEQLTVSILNESSV